jgi:cytochrome c biogenesis protein CcmG, thiol:disulfide interchange protein DsbE
MRGTLMLTGMVVAGAALVGVALFGLPTDGPREPAPAEATQQAGDSPVLTASVAHAGGIDEAARELELIRPPRPKQAADFTVSLVSGETLKLQGQRGKPMLVNFWATWCAPCREEMPAMERLYIKHRERGFVLLAVSVDTDASVVKPFLERYKLTFPVALDAKMDLANAYGVRALPASFLIDRNGYLTALALGPRAWDNRAAHTLVEGMLAQ